MIRSQVSLLITGTSHVGKTTLATLLAEKVGYETYHTDKLGRHPGRPWPKMRNFIEDYYSSLQASTVFKLLLIHHQNMWPNIQSLIESKAFREGAILEGSALRPEYIHSQIGPTLKGVCLTADELFISNRIRKSCKYETLSVAHQKVVDGFVERSLLDDREQVLRAKELGIRCLKVDEPGILEDFEVDFLRMIAHS